MMIKFILVYLLLPYSVFAQNLDNILSELSLYEKEALECIFHMWIDEDQFGYTLFGDKPVSLSGDSYGGVFWKNWTIWKKVEKDLSITNYLFIEEPAYNCHDHSMGFVFFINKKAFLETVNRHLQTFRNVLGQDITAVKLLKDMEQKQAFMKLLKNSELLLGILLGYGEHNAQLFARRVQLLKFISAKTLPILPEGKPLPSPNFSSIEEEENVLSQRLQAFSDYSRAPWIISPVEFAADLDHNETKALQKRYDRCRSEISRLYSKNKNFLEWIIRQLTTDPLFQE